LVSSEAEGEEQEAEEDASSHWDGWDASAFPLLNGAAGRALA